MNIVITAGGTEEPIDKVRKITNMSTGKLGSIICNELCNDENNNIFYICNKKSIKPKEVLNIQIIETTDTKSVEIAIHNILNNNKIDVFIHSMAISDYSVEGAYYFEKSHYGDMDITLEKIDNSSKMKSSEDEIYLKLVKTPKIIDSIKVLDKSLKLISFKLLNNVPKSELISVGLAQLKRTNSFIVVANDLTDIKNGNHKAQLIKEDGTFFEVNSKEEIARTLKDLI